MGAEWIVDQNQEAQHQWLTQGSGLSPELGVESSVLWLWLQRTCKGLSKAQCWGRSEEVTWRVSDIAGFAALEAWAEVQVLGALRQLGKSTGWPKQEVSTLRGLEEYPCVTVHLRPLASGTRKR